MAPTWMEGEERIRRLLQEGALERIPVDEDHVRSLLAKSKTRCDSARSVLDDDPGGALQMAYDAARKAFSAILAAQGIRPASMECHGILAESASAQLSAVMDFEVGSFNAMRVKRDRIIHPEVGAPDVTPRDARLAVDAAALLGEKAQLVVTMVEAFE